jgi:hypothetical protein
VLAQVADAAAGPVSPQSSTSPDSTRKRARKSPRPNRALQPAFSARADAFMYPPSLATVFLFDREAPAAPAPGSRIVAFANL